MTELKSGAFRVWDSVEKRYGSGSQSIVFVLGENGVLYFGDNRSENLYALAKANPSRYQAEMFSGLPDRNGHPLYENDVVWYESLQKENFDCVAVVRQVRGSCYGLVIREFDFSDLDEDIWLNLGQFRYTDTPDLKPLIIGTIHDDPAMLEAKARGLT